MSVMLIALVSASLISGLYSGALIGGNQSQNVYSLTLVVTNVSSNNSTLSNMDVFFVLHDNQLVTSSVIKVPFGTLVRITIINHDNGLDPLLVPSDAAVSGVLNNQMQVYNSLSVSQSAIASGSGSQVYSKVATNDISHTFTVSSGLNIPILPHSTEVAYTYFNTQGTFSWACMCNCGPFSMSTPGWMIGQIVVLPP